MATLNRTQAIPLADYQTSIFTLPETNIQVQATHFYFEVARCTTLTPDIWPNSTTELDVKLEISTDNGSTWQFLAGFRAPGGILVRRDGTEATITNINTPIGTGNQRKIRGTAEVINGPLRTQGFYETRDSGDPSALRARAP